MGIQSSCYTIETCQQENKYNPIYPQGISRIRCGKEKFSYERIDIPLQLLCTSEYFWGKKIVLIKQLDLLRFSFSAAYVPRILPGIKPHVVLIVRYIANINLSLVSILQNQNIETRRARWSCVIVGMNGPCLFFLISFFTGGFFALV